MPGWTLDVLPTRLGPDEPWSYKDRARELLADTRTVLDMGTGGGERFSEICEGYSGRAVAIEEWTGNIRVAADRLGSMGIPVARATCQHLPFSSGSFDLVLDRHEGFAPDEVVRVLAPGGSILTQQVGRSNWQELTEFFPHRTDWGPLFEVYVEAFREAGLSIVNHAAHDRPAAYGSLGDVVYLLTVAPWEVPGFDLEADLDALLALERDLYREGRIMLTESLFMIEARKAAT